MIVSDSVTGEPLTGVTLRIPALAKGGISGDNGFVRIEHLPTGTVQLEATLFGYHPYSQSIMLPTAPADTLLIRLSPNENDLEEVIVQSTRTGNRVEDSPIKVEVLGRDDMDEENSLKPNNVASILGDYSGVQIQSTGLSSGNAVVRIQGLAGRYTQILRDGLPLYAGLSSDFGILQIQPLDLQQIELIKGPASTFFGGGAIAGVVNFISKTPGIKPERAVTINQTTLGETNTTAWFSGRNKHWGYTAFGGATRAVAKDVDGDGFTDVPDLLSATLHPRLFYYANNGAQFALGFTYTGEKRSGGDLLAVKGRADSSHVYIEENASDRSVADLQYRYSTKDGSREWTAKAAVSQYARRRSLPDWTFNGAQQNWFVEAAYKRRVNQHIHWVGGLNYSGDAFQKGKTDSLQFSNFQNQSSGVFGQTAFHRGKLDAEAGLRIDWRSTWGTFALPSAALLYHLTKSLSFRAGLGLGYLTPNVLNAGDADINLRRQMPLLEGLEADRSLGGNLEWNYHQLFGDHFILTWNQQFFYTRLNHPVLNLAAPDGNLFWSNASNALTTTGVDHYLRLLYNEVELYLGYTFQDARQLWDASRPEVPLTPRHRAAGVFSLPLGKHFQTGLESAWTGRQVLESGTKTVPYWFAAALIGFHYKQFYFVLNGENLLDFRQTRHESVVLPPFANPTFRPLWAPVDGRVINFAVRWQG